MINSILSVIPIVVGIIWTYKVFKPISNWKLAPLHFAAGLHTCTILAFSIWVPIDLTIAWSLNEMWILKPDSCIQTLTLFLAGGAWLMHIMFPILERVKDNYDSIIARKSKICEKEAEQ